MSRMREATSILPLKVEGLSFEAEGRRLLDGVGFAVPRGGVTALVGPNGAGKSLTLRLCHGLLAPSAGRVDWAAETSRKRHAMVFQRPVMLRRSARANLVHALQAGGFDNAGDRAAAALERFGLSAIAERPARLLSGGEQQRLAIARAAALEPEFLFLDEPTAHLDPGATRQIEAMIGLLAAEGVTMLMTTHDLGQARRLCRRVLFLHRGRLVEDAPAADFLSRPSTEEGRTFITGDLLW